LPSLALHLLGEELGKELEKFPVVLGVVGPDGKAGDAAYQLKTLQHALLQALARKHALNVLFAQFFASVKLDGKSVVELLLLLFCHGHGIELRITAITIAHLVPGAKHLVPLNQAGRHSLNQAGSTSHSAPQILWTGPLDLSARCPVFCAYPRGGLDLSARRQAPRTTRKAPSAARCALNAAYPRPPYRVRGAQRLALSLWGAGAARFWFQELSAGREAGRAGHSALGAGRRAPGGCIAQNSAGRKGRWGFGGVGVKT